jgi:hypothetical protein
MNHPVINMQTIYVSRDKMDFSGNKVDVLQVAAMT